VSLYALVDRHELIDPILLAAFDGWVDLLQQGTATSSGAGLQCA
jgi:hypothetical protein